MLKFADARRAPLAVTVVDESALTEAGLPVLLTPFADRAVLIDRAAAQARPDSVDVVLYEPRLGPAKVTSQVGSLLDGGAGVAIAFSWSAPEAVSVPDGVVCLPKSLTAAQLVVALEEVVAGRHPGLQVRSTAGDDRRTASAAARPPAPGPQARALTARERDVLSLITAGLPNRDIAARLGLSLNSVKTYIRTAYRKIGAERRTQAMLWGLEHGLTPNSGAVPTGG